MQWHGPEPVKREGARHDGDNCEPSFGVDDAVIMSARYEWARDATFDSGDLSGRKPVCSTHGQAAEQKYMEKDQNSYGEDNREEKKNR